MLHIPGLAPPACRRQGCGSGPPPACLAADRPQAGHGLHDWTVYVLLTVAVLALTARGAAGLIRGSCAAPTARAGELAQSPVPRKPRAQIAQLVEQGTENPRVGSSILSLGTIHPGAALIFRHLPGISTHPCISLFVLPTPLVRPLNHLTALFFNEFFKDSSF